MKAAHLDVRTPHPADLWHQFARPLRSFIGRRAPQEVETEDLLQDVFLRIQKNLPRLRDSDRIDAWIFQIARAVVADAFRRRARGEAWTEVSAAEIKADDVAAPVASEEHERAAEIALASCLANLIGHMQEPYRQAIELTEIRGMTQVAAARAVGVSTSGMKSRVQRGRRQLKAVIEQFCRIETDVRGSVIECDPLRPLRPSNDSMDMTNSNEQDSPKTTTDNQSEAAGCCGGAAPSGSDACCALDAEVKATGGSGCGCASKAPSTTKKGCC